MRNRRRRLTAAAALLITALCSSFAAAEQATPENPLPKTTAPDPKRASKVADKESALEALPPGTKHEHLMLPLKDGVKLATEIFTPPGDGPWPVILMRTPYSRFDVKGRLSGMGNASFVTVTQNVRGRYGSEGAGTFPEKSFDNEIQDSYDVIEWIAKQKWCNGKVGMVGVSGHGMAACNAVWSGAPHLIAVEPSISADSSELYWSFHNGVRREFYTWLGQRGVKVTDWPRPTTTTFDPEAHEAFIKERGAAYKGSFTNNSGWYDLFSQALLDTFVALAPNSKVFITINNQGHGGIGGGLTYPKTAAPKEHARTLKEWMTEDAPKTPTESTLVYYLMGDPKDPAAPGNVWKVTHKWPVDNTPTSYFLQKDGSLTTDAPKDKDASLTYTYDPKDPAPSIGGNFNTGAKNGPYDLSPLKDRKDILHFETAPLAEPVGVTGKIWVELNVSSDVPDTEFVVTLVDIYPDGYQAWVREGAYMARYANGLAKPAPIEKEKTYKLAIDCWSTALVFNKDHKIGVLVSSSSSPGYEAHPNTYEPCPSIDKTVVAHNTIHLSADQPSKLILPVIAKETYAK